VDSLAGRSPGLVGVVPAVLLCALLGLIVGFLLCGLLLLLLELLELLLLLARAVLVALWRRLGIQ